MASIGKLKSSSHKSFSFRFRGINGTSAITILVGIVVVLFFFSFVLGRYPISPPDVIKVLVSQVIPISQTWPDILNTVVMQIRLPRIMASNSDRGVGSGRGHFSRGFSQPWFRGHLGFHSAVSGQPGDFVSGNWIAIEVFRFFFA
jgi:iron complex transport system permease protein